MVPSVVPRFVYLSIQSVFALPSSPVLLLETPARSVSVEVSHFRVVPDCIHTVSPSTLAIADIPAAMRASVKYVGSGRSAPPPFPPSCSDVKIVFEDLSGCFSFLISSYNKKSAISRRTVNAIV